MDVIEVPPNESEAIGALNFDVVVPTEFRYMVESTTRNWDDNVSSSLGSYDFNSFNNRKANFKITDTCNDGIECEAFNLPSDLDLDFEPLPSLQEVQAEAAAAKKEEEQRQKQLLEAEASKERERMAAAAKEAAEKEYEQRVHAEKEAAAMKEKKDAEDARLALAAEECAAAKIAKQKQQQQQRDETTKSPKPQSSISVTPGSITHQVWCSENISASCKGNTCISYSLKGLIKASTTAIATDTTSSSNNNINIMLIKPKKGIGLFDITVNPTFALLNAPPQNAIVSTESSQILCINSTTLSRFHQARPKEGPAHVLRFASNINVTADHNSQGQPNSLLPIRAKCDILTKANPSPAAKITVVIQSNHIKQQVSKPLLSDVIIRVSLAPLEKKGINIIAANFRAGQAGTLQDKANSSNSSSSSTLCWIGLQDLLNADTCTDGIVKLEAVLRTDKPISSDPSSMPLSTVLPLVITGTSTERLFSGMSINNNVNPSNQSTIESSPVSNVTNIQYLSKFDFRFM
jgi:hypothetical protein